MIQFVARHDDLSSDKGYQFRFYCDKCHSSYLSGFQPSKAGIAGSLLRAAGSLLGGIAGSASYSSYDLQRMASGPEHNSALKAAVEEGARHFRQCGKCGRWVCLQACWDAKAGCCEECAAQSAGNMAAAPVCRHCGATVNAAKFCPECGKPTAPEKRICGGCGVTLEPTVKFCGECGWKAQ